MNRNEDLLMNDTFDNLIFTPDTTQNLLNLKQLKQGNSTFQAAFDESINLSQWNTQNFIKENTPKPKKPPEPSNLSYDSILFDSWSDSSLTDELNKKDATDKINCTTQNSATKREDFLFVKPTSQPEKANLSVEISSHDKDKSTNCEEKLDGYKCAFSEQPENSYNKKTINLEEKLELSKWGLPEAVLRQYEAKKVTKMFPWQVECLHNENVLKKYKNLVYSAPTSAGKTLVAEILALKTVMERKKKVIIILPFVSVVREKTFYFQDLLEDSGVRVEGFMGSYNPPGGFEPVKIAICTIEKANSLINRLLEEKKLEEIGCVVVDEIHLLGDSSRGYLLELLLTKLKYISKREENVNIQIIGMSATLPNLNLIATWLEAELYTTEFRPIPLFEQALICGEFYNNKMEVTRKLNPIQELGTDTDNILQLCLETIQENCSVLIFCPSKNWCENLSQQLSAAFFKLGSSNTKLGLMLRAQLNTELIMEVLEQLKASPIGLDEVLKQTVSFGVAFHHAGLTMDERDIVEGAFRNGALRVLVATSTLSSGVNLPARRVIIRTPKFYGRPINSLTYKQMIGRAGRMGKDSRGESLLICQKNEFNIAKELMQVDLEPVFSCLEGSGKLKRAVLEVIASGVASTPEDVSLFTSCTLLAVSERDDSGTETLADPIKSTIEFLHENEFIRLQTTENGTQKYVATALAKACLSSSLPPEEGLTLFEELEKARRCFVLETELHLIYLVTPYSACNQWGTIDWMMYLDIWTKLPPQMQRVGELVGIKESYMVSASRGKTRTDTPQLYHKFSVHKRFFVALVLQDLVNEKSLVETCYKFNCNRGMLQGLQQSAATFAGMVTAFSRELRWSTVEILISQFQDRLQYGVSRDLLDLMRIPILNGQRARALFDSGIESLVDLANSDVNTIENFLHKVAPFESEKRSEKTKLRNIWISGKNGVTEREAAEILVKTARKFLQAEMGLAKAEWENNREKEAVETATCLENDGNIVIPSDLHNKSKNDSLILSDQSLFESSYGSLNTNITRNSFNELNSPETSNKRRLSDLDCDASCKKNKCEATPVDFSKIEIVDVCKNRSIFESFQGEFPYKKAISFAVACSYLPQKSSVIGGEVVFNQNPTEVNENVTIGDGVKKVEGISFCWGANIVYHLNLLQQDYVPLIKRLFMNKFKHTTFKAFGCKEHLKVLKDCLGVELDAQFEDSKVADWLLEPEGKEKNFTAMVTEYLPEMLPLLELTGCYYKGVGSIALDTNSSISAKLRASVESVVNFYLIDSIKGNFNHNLHEIEMKCTVCLLKMEVVGIKVDEENLRNIVNLMKNHLKALELKAHGLAGRKFSIKSSKEVANVIGLKKSNTKKDVLKKNENPVSAVVLEWRKIHCILTKMVLPLLQAIKNDCIYSSFVIFNSTGRITMHEPNLQNVAKDFDLVDPVSGAVERISLRSVFVPRETFIFVSADYCQIELRLLAHFCEDHLLNKILQSESDIFKSIAAKWNKTSQTEVTDIMRQQTKQICYGIIYGMGSKTLSEQLNVEEDEAVEFMQNFHSAFPKIKTFIKTTVEKCRENGFVETLFGRKRFLPHINEQNPALKSQAERQAINTTIQGSAADIAKKAMVDVESTFESLFRDHKSKPQMVLHMHDELVYEVPLEYMNYASNIIKNTMEQAVDLTVPFPVKLKKGTTWGDLTEFVL